jgi:hypothetical protein
MPWYKWQYFESRMDSIELEQARMIVLKLWENQYSKLEVDQAEPPPPIQIKKVRLALLFNLRAWLI